MSDRRLHISQIRGDRHQASRVDESPRCITTTFYLERDDAAERRLLTLGELVLRVRRQPRVVHPAHFRLLLEPTRQLERCRRLCTHPELESFQAFKEHPSIERAHA